jgi:3-oxocholest-4-en-26-oyl-CoA dehydrogenase beta subunit
MGTAERELRDVARDFLASHSPVSHARRLLDSEAGFDRRIWQLMSGMDWMALGHPVDAGGAGGGLLHLAVLYREMGRVLLSSPALYSSVISGYLLERLPAADLPLGSVLSGERIVASALAVSGTASARETATGFELRPQAGGGLLDGRALMVPYANCAGHCLIAARVAGEDDPVGSFSLVLADLHGPGVVLRHMPNIAGLPLFELRLTGVRLADKDVLGRGGPARQAAQSALARASVLRAAEIAGAGEAVLELATQYAKDRVQFGRAIGSYQAVQYLCTDIAIAVHVTSLLVHAAAAAVDAGSDPDYHVAAARAYAGRAAGTIARCAHEIFAGVGFMLEHDLPLYSRRLRHWEADLGTEDLHRERLVQALLRGRKENR